VGKPEGKRPLVRSRLRWVGNNKLDFQEVGCERTDWIDVAQDNGEFLDSLAND